MGIVEWHKFPEGEEPHVLTGISELCDEGKHAECPSHAKSDEHGGETVFCICRCHQVGSEESSREYPILVAHSAYGDPECCGIVMPVTRGDLADLTCNECAAVIRTLPAADAKPTLLQMAMAEGFCSEVCPLCGEMNTFPGFTSMEAFTCRHCGEGVVVQRPIQ